MRVLVTGGTGVVGRATVDHLVARGHTVRVLSRHAERDAKQWPHGVEAAPGDILDAPLVMRAAEGCDVVVHAAGIVAEEPPGTTFQRVNVDATRIAAEAAEAAGARRFIYVSSYGAERGSSRYHQSKLRGERAATVACKHTNVVLARVGNVYGPGDEVLSLLLRMVRLLPVVGDGETPFQPIWAEDVGEALARTAEAKGNKLPNILDMLGPDLTSMNGVLDAFETITGKKPVRLRVLPLLAKLGAGAADRLRLGLPIHLDEVQMLLDGNALPRGTPNPLVERFDLKLTPLHEGLLKLADASPEQLPQDGTGTLTEQRYSVEVRGARKAPEQAIAYVRDRFCTLIEEGAVSPDDGDSFLELGDTRTMTLPMRGQVQVRLDDVQARSITFVTLAGHPLAGAIQFSASGSREQLQLEVTSWTRGANLVDLAAMRVLGWLGQEHTWRNVLARLVKEVGGRKAGRIHSAHRFLSESEARGIERWLDELVTARKRAEAA